MKYIYLVSSIFKKISKWHLIITAVLLLALPFYPRFIHADEFNDLVVEKKNFVLSEEEVKFIESLPPLRIMIDDNFVPLSSYDIKSGKYHGISVDLFRHFAEILGIKYELIYDKSLSWADKVELFKNRKADMLMPASITAERSQTGLFTSSISEAYYGAIIKKTNNIKIKVSSDMAAYKIGVVKETAIIPFIQSIAPASQIISYDSFTALYQAVRNGEVDIALQNEDVFREDRFNLELFDLTVRHKIVESPRKYSYYFNNTESFKRLITIIDRYLSVVDYSMLVASYQRGVEEMILRYNEQKNQKRVMIAGIAGSAVLLILLGITIRNHRRFAKELAATLKQVQNSEEKLKTIIETSPDGITITSLDGIIQFATAKAVSMWNYDSADELIGRNVREFVHESYHEKAIHLMTELINGNLTGVAEFLMVRKGESHFYAEANANILRDANNNQIGILFFERDITGRRRAEEKLQITLSSLRKAVSTTIQVLVAAIEARDPYTAGHQKRVADLACAIAKEMGHPPEMVEGIRMAGCIHDIGKLSLPAEILSKPTKLTALEFALIKEHSQSGYEILKDVESPWQLAEMVYQHHERMDGSGYPRKLQGKDIIIEARILAVADVVEAMASDRPYRPSLGIDPALAEIEKNRGIFYDDAVVAAGLRLFREKGFKLENTLLQKVSQQF